MPIIVGILALCLLLLLGWSFGNTDKQAKQNTADENRLKKIEEELQTTKIAIKDIEKRILNIEDIVTDAKFEDTPTTGREAINLKAEMNELKSMLINLKR